VNGQVQNIFMEWVDPNEAGPPPCRVIPITDEIRAKDAADRAARETRPDWAIKAELSQENLHLVRRKVGPNRIEPKPRVTAAPRRVRAPKAPRPVKEPTPPRTRPTCGECKASLAWNSQATLCPKCTKLAARPKCSNCSAVLTRNKRGDLCTKCQDQAKPRPAPATALPAPVPATQLVRVCKCGRRLRPSNQRDTCFECAGLILNKEQRLARRVKCDTPACERLLRFGRTSGLCCDCTDRSADRHEIATRHRLKKIAEAGKTCMVCGVPIKWDTKSGCCIKHAAQLRSSRVILHAATREEHELNVLWSSLCLEDKWAVLEESLQGGDPNVLHGASATAE